MKRRLKLLLKIFVLLLIVEMAAGYFFYTKSIGIETRNTSWYLDKPASADSAWFSKLKTASFEVETERDSKIRGTIIKGADSANITMVLCHGITASRWAMFKYAKPYVDWGYNVLLYDHTGHGVSDGNKVTYGFWEKQDLQKVVEFAKEQFPNTTIGLHGESMGAAVILQHLPINNQQKDVAFYIADCPYSDLEDMFVYRLKEDFGLPNLWLIESAALLNKAINGFWFSEVSPKAALKTSDSPVLLIHGDADTYVPTRMSEEMYAARKKNSRLVLIKGATHANAINTDPELYAKSVAEFVALHGK